MDEIKRDVPKTLRDRVSALRYLMVLAALAAVAAAGYTFLPDAEVSAQEEKSAIGRVGEEAPEVATQEMIDYALNLRTASGYTVYAEKGVVDRGSSEIRGAQADALRSPEGKRSTKELSNSIDALRQLPCTSLKSGALGGRSFGPGVYCLDSAELAGEMTLNGGGNAAGTYIFRVAGTLNAKSGSSIRLEDGAQGGNVYFVASEVEIGDNAAFRANVLASGTVKVGRNATVTDKVMALGKVELDNSALLGGTTGTMKLCVDQTLPAAGANDLADRIFHFTVTGTEDVGTAANPVRVQTGTCSDSFDVTAGPQTVTELFDGTLAGGGSFIANFELVDVVNQTPASTSTLVLANLATRAASVNIVAGGTADQLTLKFTNRRAILGFIEICKRAAAGPGPYNVPGTPLSGGDADVTGFFQYTIEDVYSVNMQNPAVKTLQIFTVPAGQCSGPIGMRKGDVSPFGGGPSFTSAIISELPRVGTYFEGTEIQPFERRNGPDIRGSIVGVLPDGGDQVAPAAGGGYVSVVILEAASSNDRTKVTFFNRSNPSRFKVCKIAGPGIPINTLFRFTVTGYGQLAANHPQAATFGTVTRTFDVRAGDPAQGGTCEFVPGIGSPAPGYNQFQTFVNGTPLTVVENGISPNNTIPQNEGQLRVSLVRVFGSGFTPGVGTNPALEPNAESVARATFTVRAPIVEVEFSGYRFVPTVLKICSVSTSGPQTELTHTYKVDLVVPQINGSNPGPMFPAFSTTLTVLAGPPGPQNGNCSFVNTSAFPGGALPRGMTINIQQFSSSGNYSQLLDLSCPTCGPSGFSRDMALRTATLSGPEGMGQQINTVVFTTIFGVCRAGERSSASGSSNDVSSRPGCTPRYERYDFDRDWKADPAVYSPATSNFSYLSSVENYAIKQRAFGTNTDKQVAADYDGDGKTDYAVWRPTEGRWYIQGSTNIFVYYNWGENGDIPLTGDYDGDRRSDMIIFRPSNSTWYMRTSTDQFIVFQFGVSTDKPVLADYDGDGRTDVAVFRDGTWYTKQSSVGFRVAQFGQTGDVPVPSDYDGDGAADLAVFRAGNWYMRSATAYTVRVWGQPGDVPVPADYDGDARTNMAVYRAAEGKWYINQQTVGGDTLIFTLGGPGDIPVQAP